MNTSPALESLQKEIDEIKARNKKVEADKAWETSIVRKVLVMGLTYIVIASFFVVADLAKPFVNAIVPSAAFLLSTLTVPVVKRVWINKRKFKSQF
ncbi:hypothetical protein KKC94_02415 [Patescibacteria group bacterium]|nr:hypothetical protein [Patescibacteria group bacterium]